MTVIDSKVGGDGGARAHTRGNALAGDCDRIESARLTAERLQRSISVRSEARTLIFDGMSGHGWEHYCDSVGGVQSICPERVPS